MPTTNWKLGCSSVSDTRVASSAPRMSGETGETTRHGGYTRSNTCSSFVLRRIGRFLGRFIECCQNSFGGGAFGLCSRQDTAHDTFFVDDVGVKPAAAVVARGLGFRVDQQRKSGFGLFTRLLPSLHTQVFRHICGCLRRESIRQFADKRKSTSICSWSAVSISWLCSSSPSATATLILL